MPPMKSIKDIRIEDAQDLFDSIIFLRGEEYFEEGCVKSIEPVNSTTLTGVVRGNQNYNASISIDSEGELVCDCSCPCDFNCKHAAALLLKWLSVKDGQSEGLEEGKPLNKEPIEQIIAKKSKEELAEILKGILAMQPELKSLITIERKEIVSKIRALFSDFWEWNEAGRLVSELQTILEGIKRNKPSWGRESLGCMESCSGIMAKNIENVHDEGELGQFLEDWFETYGEMFSATKPVVEEKKKFIRRIMGWTGEDDYGLEGSYERALIGMCSSPEDAALIKKLYKPKKSEGWGKEHHARFHMELYEKLGMDDKYIKLARRSGFTSELIEKLISLNRLEEALEECKKSRRFSLEIENQKVLILKKLGRADELKKTIFGLLKKTGDYAYAAKLKGESSRREWKNYIRQIVSDAKGRGDSGLISRIYYNEGDFKRAYEHSEKITDRDYLELLAKRLGTEYPDLASNLFKRLCFGWIEAGAGWPYKKAGKMLEAIKKLDKGGDFFRKTKEEVIAMHRRKYSLMWIVEEV